MDHSFQKRRHARPVDCVDRDKHPVAARSLDRIDTGLAPVGAPARHDDKGTSPCQSLGEGPAEHAGASDDDGRAAREPEQVFEIGFSHESVSCVVKRSAHRTAEIEPLGVERARLVGAFVGVGAEVVALGLQQVCR